MNIGFDAKRFFYNRTGLGNYSRNLLFSLFEYFPQNNYFLFKPKKKHSLVHSTTLKYPNVNIIEPRHCKVNAFWRTFKIPKLQIFNQLDIYHGLSHELPFGIHKTKVKKILTVHDLIFIRFPNLYKWIDRKIYTKKIKYSIWSADVVVAISQQTKKDLIELLNTPEEKIKVIYQSCNKIFFKTVDNQKKHVVKQKYNLPERYILFVGTVEKRKNVLNLLKAYYIAKIPKNIRLVILGRHTQYAKVLYNFIKDKAPKPLFITNVDFEDMPAIYQMSDLFVYPSFYEGFGIPILEAMVSGVPVITSQGGVFAETADNAAIFVDPYDYNSIAYAIEKRFTDANFIKNLLLKARNHIQKFTHKVIAQEYFNLYLETLVKS